MTLAAQPSSVVRQLAAGLAARRTPPPRGARLLPSPYARVQGQAAWQGRRLGTGGRSFGILRCCIKAAEIRDEIAGFLAGFWVTVSVNERGPQECLRVDDDWLKVVHGFCAPVDGLILAHLARYTAAVCRKRAAGEAS